MSATLPPTAADRWRAWRADIVHIAQLGWPVLVGQLSMLAFATIDTVLLARSSATDLAAFAVGGAAFVTVFIGFMGVVMALSPIVGQLHGAQKFEQAGRQVHQAVWLALLLAAVGMVLLAFPAPFLALADASPEVETKVRHYLLAQTFAIPGSLLFAVFRAFNNAVSRPAVAMRIQLVGLALKALLSVSLVFGVPALGVPALGIVGCGIATSAAMWLHVGLAWRSLRRDPFYTRYALLGRGLDKPNRAALAEQWRLGLPMGASILVEVTAFSFMALFIARLGTTAVAGHQIVMNLVSIMFMLPLSLGNAAATLVAQHMGAGLPAAARRIGWHAVWLGLAIAGALGTVVFFARVPLLRLYTDDGAVLAAALPLMAWLVLFHGLDATQALTAAVLRGYKVATAPMWIYVAALWGVGLGGGWLLAFDAGGVVPAALHGARGFWIASTAGLLVAAGALTWLMAHTMNRARSAVVVVRAQAAG